MKISSLLMLSVAFSLGFSFMPAHAATVKYAGNGEIDWHASVDDLTALDKSVARQYEDTAVEWSGTYTKEATENKADTAIKQASAIAGGVKGLQQQRDALESAISAVKKAQEEQTIVDAAISMKEKEMADMDSSMAALDMSMAKLDEEMAALDKEAENIKAGNLYGEGLADVGLVDSVTMGKMFENELQYKELEAKKADLMAQKEGVVAKKADLADQKKNMEAEKAQLDMRSQELAAQKDAAMANYRQAADSMNAADANLRNILGSMDKGASNALYGEALKGTDLSDMSSVKAAMQTEDGRAALQKNLDNMYDKYMSATPKLDLNKKEDRAYAESFIQALSGETLSKGEISYLDPSVSYLTKDGTGITHDPYTKSQGKTSEDNSGSGFNPLNPLDPFGVYGQFGTSGQ